MHPYMCVCRIESKRSSNRGETSPEEGADDAAVLVAGVFEFCEKKLAFRNVKKSLIHLKIFTL